MSRFARVNCLVVDDNHHMRLIISAMLRSMGIVNIRDATDGVEALEILRDWSCDVIILDIVMETLDGIDLTRLLRTSSDSPAPFIPIIMLSGHSDRSKVLAARDAGVNEFIAKPLAANALIQRLQSILANDRAWVKSPGFTGPDRRRRKDAKFTGPYRRKEDEAKP